MYETNTPSPPVFKPQLTFTFYFDNGKRRKEHNNRRPEYILCLRIGEELQDYLGVCAGDKIAINHHFNNEFILYLQNAKNVTHQLGHTLTTGSGRLTNEEHKKKDKKPALYVRNTWADNKAIPLSARKSSIAQYQLLPGNILEVNLGIKT